MSNSYERKNVSDCENGGNYSSLENTTRYSCDLPCLCRFSDERSDMDKMYYDWFVMKKPIALPPPGVNLPQPENNCNQK